VFSIANTPLFQSAPAIERGGKTSVMVRAAATDRFQSAPAIERGGKADEPHGEPHRPNRFQSAPAIERGGKFAEA